MACHSLAMACHSQETAAAAVSHESETAVTAVTAVSHESETAMACRRTHACKKGRKQDDTCRRQLRQLSPDSYETAAAAVS